MSNEQFGLAVIGVFLAALSVALAVRSIRRRRDPGLMRNDPVEIATIVQQHAPRDGAITGGAIFLVIATIYCLLKYFSAETANQQIVALLLWIGNSMFWGSIVIANAILINRTSTVFRSETYPPPAPAERREPQL